MGEYLYDEIYNINDAKGKSVQLYIQSILRLKLHNTPRFGFK